MIKNELKDNYEKACNDYLDAFCEKHGFDAGYWIADEAVGIAEVSDYFVNMQTIMDDVDMETPEEEFVKWYDYCLELHQLEVKSTPNFRSWVRGCPRKTDAEMEELRQAKQKVDDAKKMLDALIKKINNENY